MSLCELAEINPHAPTLGYRIDPLWPEVAFRIWKDEAYARRTCAIATESVGRCWSQRLAISLSRQLDRISEWTAAQVLANVRWLASAAAEAI
jgi:predicted trehalose synthase